MTKVLAVLAVDKNMPKRGKWIIGCNVFTVINEYMCYQLFFEKEA